jgi:hypothetical protein
MTTFMNLLHIADLNATAVAQFERGENQNAASTLLEALRMLSDSTDKSDNVLVTASSNFDDYCSNSQVDQHQVETTADETHLKTNTDNNVLPSSSLTYDGTRSLIRNVVAPSCVYSLSPRNDYRMSRSQHQYEDIYNGAFLLTNDIPIARDETAAVLCFNLAMMLHREGLKVGKTSALREAMQLYQESFSLLGHDANQLCYHKSIVVIVLTAAICQNMAHIYGLFLSMDKAKDIVDRLSELVVFMDSEQLIDQEDLEFFQISAFSLRSASLRAAPAA